MFVPNKRTSKSSINKTGFLCFEAAGIWSTLVTLCFPKYLGSYQSRGKVSLRNCITEFVGEVLGQSKNVELMFVRDFTCGL